MTAEEAINLIGSMKGDLYDLGLYDDNDLTALDMAISALSERGWISTSERLPKKEGRYLCSVGAKYRNPREMYYAPQRWASEIDRATWRGADGTYVYDWFIKAWMPLPEPYKESEGMI